MKIPLLTLTILFCLLNLNIAQAKYYKCNLVYTNGDNIEAYIKMPLTALGYKLKVKYDEDGKSEKIKIEELRFIEVFYGSNNKALFKVGQLSKYSKRLNDFKPLMAPLYHIGIVMGIHGDIILTRHGGAYEIKKKQGVEQMYTVYNEFGYSSWLSKIESSTIAPLRNLTSSKESNVDNTINLLFTDSDCKSIVTDLEKAELKTVNDVLELLKQYAECAKK